jgi:hypothetical protein
MPDPTNPPKSTKQKTKESISNRANYLFGNTLTRRNFTDEPNDPTKGLHGAALMEKSLLLNDPKSSGSGQVILSRDQYNKFDPKLPSELMKKYGEGGEKRREAIDFLKQYEILANDVESLDPQEFTDVVNYFELMLPDLNDEYILNEARKRYGDPD